VNDQDKDLITTSFLSQFSIAINDTLCLFICLSCGSGHTTPGLLEHLKKKHAHTGFKKEHKAAIQTLAESANISDSYPIIISSETPPAKYSGLPVHSSAGCPHCPFVNSTKKLINQHLKAEHAELGGQAEENIPTQVINRGVTKNLFRVTLPTQTEAPQQTDAILKDFQNFNWKSVETALAIPNARMISPWLMRTGWHLHVQPYDKKQLGDLVKMPEKDTFPGLHENVTQYFETATNLLNDTDELVLQRINTADPDKT
jgi:hypothetical protein